MDRHLKNSGDKIKFLLYVDSVLTNSEQDVTVQIKDGASVNVGSVGTASRPSTGTYEFQPTMAQMGTLDIYSADWAVRLNGENRTYRTHYEVVGGFYFTVAEAKTLAGMSAVVTQDIINARERIEEMIEKRFGITFVPRGRRLVLNGRSNSDLVLSDWFVREIYSVRTIDGAVTTSYTAAEVADLAFGSRLLFRRDGTVFPWGTQNVLVHYAYGMDEPPEPVKRAALLMTQASFVLTDSDGNPTRPLSSVLFEIPEVKELLADYESKDRAYSIQVGT